MNQPLFANKQHEIMLTEFLNMNKDLVKEVANEVRLKNYNQVFNIVIDYHNNYGKNRTNGNWHDWLMILPINISVLTNGFLAGIETKRNQAIVTSYRVVLNELVHNLVDKIEKLEPVNE
jgi:hypothetical protein